MIKHGGGLGSYLSTMMYLLEAKWGIVVFCNPQVKLGIPLRGI